MGTFGDFVTITNNGSADAESAASTMAVTPGATITEITVQDLTLGHTYAVKIDFPGITSPQKYVVSSNGAAGTNGGKIVPGWERIPCRIQVPQGLSNVSITTYADTASATVKVGLKWQNGSGGQTTFSDFITGSAGTSEAKLGSINVPGGKTLKAIVTASRLSVGLLEYVRLDFAGIQAPQKYITAPTIYDAVGTEVQNTCLYGTPPIPVDITIPSNVNSVDIYTLSQTASNTCAVSLVWV